MPTVVAAWTKVIVDYAAQHGLDVTRPDVDLSHRDLRVPAHLDDAIWQAADDALGDDDLGFSEARAFRRAFRRSTGLVPSALRPA